MIDLHYTSTSARWARFGTLICWILLLGGAGWTWFLWHISVRDYYMWHNPAYFWGAENMVPTVIVWLLGVLPYAVWIILRWAITGRWWLLP